MQRVRDECDTAKATRLPLLFQVDGPPVPKARARVVNGHAHTPEKTRGYERHVGLVALAAVRRHASWRTDWAAYALHVEVYRQYARGDADNYGKAIADGINRIVYLDDAAVREIHVVVREDCVRPRVEVRVEMLGEETLEQHRKIARRRKK